MEDHNGSIGSTMEREEGNTKNRAPLGMYWCFTLNNYSEQELDQILEIAKNYKYIIGEEIGEQGTPHLQGFIQSEKRFRANEKFKNNRIHWERCKSNEIDNIKYCSKSSKYHTNIDIKKKVLQDPLEGMEPYDWQRNILDIIKEDPHPRKIMWYWEKKGCAGKTTLAKHICMNYDAIYVNGKSSDIKCAITQSIEKKKKGPDIVIFGIPRDKEDYVQYSALEEVKDGIFFSGKYESGMVMFNIPHIIVFANFKPDVKKLSEDRWSVIHLVEEEEEENQEDQEANENTDSFGLDGESCSDD